MVPGLDSSLSLLTISGAENLSRSIVAMRFVHFGCDLRLNHLSEATARNRELT